MSLHRRLASIKYKLLTSYTAHKGYMESVFCKASSPIMSSPIDFVVTWVDGNDPEWRAEKRAFSPDQEKGNSDARYREWDQFMFWFRAVEKYAPWVRYVFLITWGHLPAWLNLSHPKLKIIKHEEYIPNSYLPTFSSIPIEMNIFRIPELAEHFVYFCDDMYLSRPVEPTDFFENGIPKYCAVAYPLRNYRYNGPFAHQQFSALGMINSMFDVNDAIRRHPGRWFHHVYGSDRKYNLFALRESYLSGIYFSHLGSPYRKTAFQAVWQELADELDAVSKNRFRSPLDFNHQIFALWEMLNGTFIPVSKDYYGVKFGTLSREAKSIGDAFDSRKHRMICLNDSIDVTDDNFDHVKAEIDEILKRNFPEKSSFEI